MRVRLPSVPRTIGCPTRHSAAGALHPCRKDGVRQRPREDRAPAREGILSRHRPVNRPGVPVSLPLRAGERLARAQHAHASIVPTKAIPISAVWTERAVENVIPDITIASGIDELFNEIVVTHPVYVDKLRTFHRLNSPVLEIRLSARMSCPITRSCTRCWRMRSARWACVTRSCHAGYCSRSDNRCYSIGGRRRGCGSIRTDLGGSENSFRTGWRTHLNTLGESRDRRVSECHSEICPVFHHGLRNAALMSVSNIDL